MGAPYIYDISRLRVKISCTLKPKYAVALLCSSHTSFMSPLIPGVAYLGKTINGGWCAMVNNAKSHEVKL